MTELIASIVDIVSAGTKVASVLSQLAQELGSAGKEASTIAKEVRWTCSTLTTLKALWNLPRIHHTMPNIRS